MPWSRYSRSVTITITIAPESSELREQLSSPGPCLTRLASYLPSSILFSTRQTPIPTQPNSFSSHLTTLRPKKIRGSPKTQSADATNARRFENPPSIHVAHVVHGPLIFWSLNASPLVRGVGKGFTIMYGALVRMLLCFSFVLDFPLSILHLTSFTLLFQYFPPLSSSQLSSPSFSVPLPLSLSAQLASIPVCDPSRLASTKEVKI